MSLVIVNNQPLSSFNTLSINSIARYYASISSRSDIDEAISFCTRQAVPLRVIGGGSNVVLEPEVDALVVQLTDNRMRVISETPDSVVLRVGGGAHWHTLVMHTIHQGWYGLENLALIPGYVGAAPIQNIGAYGVEFESVVDCVHVINCEDNTDHVLTRQACEFGYRDSIFKHALKDKIIITSIDIRLSKKPNNRLTYPALIECLKEKPHPSAKDIANAVMSIRRQKLPDPQCIPNAGSFFKNPIISADHHQALLMRFDGLVSYPFGDQFKLAAGWLIDYCGLKGCNTDGVGLHDQQALVLINPGKQDAHAVLKFAHYVSECVDNTFGVSLDIEPRVGLGYSINIGSK